MNRKEYYFKNYFKFRLLLNKKEKQKYIYLLLSLSLILCLFFYNRMMTRSENNFRTETLIEQRNNYKESNKILQNSDDLDKNATTDFNNSRIDEINSFFGKKKAKYIKYDQKQIDEYRIAEPLQSSNSIISISQEQEQKLGFNIYHYLDGKEFSNNLLVESGNDWESIRYGLKDWVFLLSLQEHLTSFVGIVIFLMFFSFGHLKDFENNKKNFLGIQPIERVTIFITDLLIFIGRILIFYIFLMLFSFTLARISGGKIDYNYPIMVNKVTEVISEPIWKIIVITSILFILNLIFYYLVMILILLFTRKLLISFILSCLLITSLSFISLESNMTLTKSVNSLSPFSYFNPRSLFLESSYEKIGNLNDGYGITDPEIETITSYDYSIFYENINYYNGKNKLSRSNNDKIAWEKGILVLSISSTALVGIVSYNYKRKMCL